MTATDFKRDRYDRPLIKQELDGTTKPYDRASSLGGVLESPFTLMQWKQRQVAKGIAKSPALQLEVIANQGDDQKKELNKVCEKAMEAEGSGDRASMGTALHLITERYDLGQDIGYLPPEIAADLDAYRRATAGMDMIAVEKKLVCDSLRVAGTTDRIVEFGGRRYIFDLKTGRSIDLGIVKIAVQLGVYSRSVGYDVETGEREGINANQEWGLVLHLPVGEAKPKLYWINLVEGWRLAQLARQIKDSQKIKMKDLVHEISLEAAA